MERATPWDPKVDDLARSFARIEAELRGDLDSLLALRLGTTLSRGSPLRRVGPAPAQHSARLGFADGLAVIAHAPDQTSILRLLVPMHRGVSVLLDAVGRTDDGVEIVLRWARTHRAQLLVTGFDQVD